ncbi:MAG: cyclase family protein [Vicinamibacteraceae bacterium]
MSHRRSMFALVFVVVSALAAMPLLRAQSAAPASQPADAAAPLDAATIDRWMTELSNWNRWGKDDERGTVNLMTDQTRKRALATVKEGVTVSLSRDTDPVKSADNGNPFGLSMVATAQDPDPFAMENLSITFHGAAYTHMDALSHMYYKGHTYNGAPLSLISAAGASRNTVTAFKRGFIGRGVLMDIPRLKGVPYLEPRTAITPADLEAWEKQAGVKVGSGDIVFFRTGRWARRAKVGPWDIGTESAGLHPSVARWLKARDVAIVGWDGHGEVMPSLVKGVDFPIHQLLLIALGTPLFDNCDLEGLAEAAGSRKRWTFLLTASPLAVPHGTGSPLNPIATF